MTNKFHESFWRKFTHHLIPNAGTLVIVALMLVSYRVWAAPGMAPYAQTMSGTISYQGMLSDADGNPLTTNANMIFRLYNMSTGGTSLWEESYTGANAVPVENGLFQVMLGSLTPIPANVWENDNVYLGLQVGSDSEMIPRELVGNVPGAIKANFAQTSELALSVPDGSITNSKLNLGGELNIGVLRSDGSLRFISADNAHLFLDADNNSTDEMFTITKNSGNFDPPRVNLLTLAENGNLSILGNLQSGAFVENNLQTPDEKESVKIDRFTQGDVLCWDSSSQSLTKCETIASPLIIAIADVNGKPIVLGAEPIKVVGPVMPGDLLIASDISGYAIAWSQVGGGNPPTGIVIAKALEASDRDRGLIKAMVMGR